MALFNYIKTTTIPLKIGIASLMDEIDLNCIYYYFVIFKCQSKTNSNDKINPSTMIYQVHIKLRP